MKRRYEALYRNWEKQDPSLLMGIFNKARGASGKLTGSRKLLEAGRIKRAFGILQSNEYEGEREYITGVSNCTCADQKYRTHFACKHMIAAMMLERIMDREAELVYAEVAYMDARGH